MSPCQAIHFGMSLENRLPEAMRDLANIVRLEKATNLSARARASESALGLVPYSNAQRIDRKPIFAASGTPKAF
jgi:hypothetical protein